MARGRRKGTGASAQAATPENAAVKAGKTLPMPSPSPVTNVVIADIVLRATGALLRDRMEKGILVRSFDKKQAHRMVEGRGMAASIALWGASHLARRSPLGLALVAGGLAAKVFYDRGKRVEAERGAERSSGRKPGRKA